MGVVVEDDGGDDDEGDSWVWGEDAAANTAAAGHSTTRRELGGEGGHGNEMSLSEKLRQHELLEQQQQKQQLQQQQQPHYIHSRRERGGAMLDADHSSGRKIPLSNNQSSKFPSSSVDSVDSGGWSWPSMSSTTSPNPTNNKPNNSTTNPKVGSSSGNNKRNQRGRQYLYNKYSKRGMFTNTVYHSQIKTRIMSAMNCTKSPQHDDDNYDNSDEEEDKDKHQQQTQNIIGMAKLGLMLLIMVGGASRLGRRRHIPRSSSSYKSMSSSSISMNDAHLRGQRPFYDAGGGRTREGNNYTLALGNLSQSTILLPVQISSHLSDITLPYNSNNNNSTDMNNASKATPYFWDVHFSGESVAEYIFSACHGLIQACELGIRQPDFNEDVSKMSLLDIIPAIRTARVSTSNFYLHISYLLTTLELLLSGTGGLQARRSSICQC